MATATLAPAVQQHDAASMRALLDAQRTAFTAALPVSRAVRIDRLDRAIAMMVDHAEDWAAACSADFGHRPRELTMISDVLASTGALKHAKKHLSSWMKGERRKSLFPLGLLGASSRVEYQPKGVVGIIAPWNFPISMVMTPLAGVVCGGQSRHRQTVRIHACRCGDVRHAGAALFCGG